MRLRRFDESLREIELARSLDPLSANIVANYGIQMQFMERYEEAIAACQEALAIDPDFTLAHSYAWFSYHSLKAIRIAAKRCGPGCVAKSSTALAPGTRRAARGATATNLALRWLANTLDGMGADSHVPARVSSLRFLAQSGEADRAMRWLERGYERREWVMGWIAAQQDLAPLRPRPDFRALVRRIEPPRT